MGKNRVFNDAIKQEPSIFRTGTEFLVMHSLKAVISTLNIIDKNFLLPFLIESESRLILELSFPR